MPKHAGFTMIELMMVVASIGILMAIAVPQFSAMLRDRPAAGAGR